MGCKKSAVELNNSDGLKEGSKNPRHYNPEIFSKPNQKYDLHNSSNNEHYPIFGYGFLLYFLFHEQ